MSLYPVQSKIFGNGRIIQQSRWTFFFRRFEKFMPLAKNVFTCGLIFRSSHAFKRVVPVRVRLRALNIIYTLADTTLCAKTSSVVADFVADSAVSQSTNL